MRRLFLSFFVSAVAAASGAHAPHTETKPCPHITLIGNEKIKLSPMEKRLVCGDSQNVPWGKIPLYQAQFHLQAFLQSRAYPHPKFEVSEDSLELRVETGSRLYAEKIEVEPTDDELLHELRRYKGQSLNPDLLDTLEDDAKFFYREHGYPCVRIKGEAWADESRVLLHAVRGPRRNFGPIESEKINGLRDEAYVRFRPFDADEVFSDSLLDLSEKRFLRQGVVQGSYFEENCAPIDGDQWLKQSFIQGPPRTLRFGVGVNTESGVVGRIQWQHHRWSEMASPLEASLYASFPEQGLLLSSDLFLLPSQPHTSLANSVESTHHRESDYEEYLLHVRSHPSWQGDEGPIFYRLQAGPSYVANWYRVRPADHTGFLRDHAVALESEVLLMSHAYESFDAHPEDGFWIRWNNDFRHPLLGAHWRALKSELQVRSVHPLFLCGQGNCIGAWRARVQNTWIEEERTSLASLPPSLKAFLGGIESLRGFSQDKLPENGGLGSLSAWNLGTEFRLRDVIANHWEPYFFVDAGVLGRRSLTMDAPFFWVPGFGLRWFSPIGLVQGYASYAFKSESPHRIGLYGYLGLGGEF